MNHTHIKYVKLIWSGKHEGINHRPDCGKDMFTTTWIKSTDWDKNHPGPEIKLILRLFQILPFMKQKTPIWFCSEIKINFIYQLLHVDQSETSVCLVEQPIRIVPVGKTFTCSGLVCIRSWKSIVTVLIRERLNKIIEFIQKVSRFEFENCLNYLQVLSSKLFSMKFSRIKPKLAHILRYFHVNFYGLIVTQKT